MAFITDVALHFCLDMTGAITFACILRGCDHDHPGIRGLLSRRPWISQSVLALVVAVATVRAIG